MEPRYVLTSLEAAALHRVLYSVLVLLEELGHRDGRRYELRRLVFGRQRLGQLLGNLFASAAVHTTPLPVLPIPRLPTAIWSLARLTAFTVSAFPLHHET